ncbi:transglutaminaseTgpA domain-containing protein [Pseudomonas sp. NPDC007930]|uniref:transglutaminase TgpA family protein n=1 Tax=Pseudomonas sp. NPDC007930 TaxID=3364417 RepID=UPI0036E7F3EA
MNLPRVGLTWLLIGQALLLVPLWLQLPPWLLLLWLACSAWRIAMYRMRAGAPGRLVRTAMVLLAALAVYFSSGSSFGLESAAALLMAAFLLKLLELHSRRDAWVLLLLGLFCQVVAYLFDASLPWALYSLLPLAALLAAMVGLQGGAGERLLPPLKRGAALLLQAVPLALLLFVFFPRMAPLWSLPLNSGQARTGLSDVIAPGDIANLAQSPELAFRASFDGPLPPRRELYWRALTLERYDGTRWQQGGLSRFQPVQAWQPVGEPWRYRVIQEPSDHPWLFALDVARTASPNVRQGLDYRLQRSRPVDQPLYYGVESWPQVRRDEALPAALRQQNLQLPASGDPRIREWAAGMARRYPQPAALVQAMLQRFHDQDYHYSLRPDTLGENAIDGFFFDTRRGFCAHYAGAMTFALRAAGIPARMVVGYQGGELNPSGNYLAVRQYDAHAWVEYWQQGQGWTRADPTFAVAPQRIDVGLAEALDADEPFLQNAGFSMLRYRDLAWLNALRLAWENLNYGWERWVLGYQQEQQGEFLLSWFKSWAGWVLPIAAGVIVALLALGLLKPWQRRADPLARSFQRFERLLRRHALVRAPGEGPYAFAERAAKALPHCEQPIHAYAQAFGQQRYAGLPPSADVLALHLASLRRNLGRPGITPRKPTP